MKLITERFVSFDNAKLLKDLGFDASCHYYYNYEGSLIFSAWVIFRDLISPDKILAPTQEVVLDWLRINYNIIIIVKPLESINSTMESVLWVGEVLSLNTDSKDAPYEPQRNPVMLTESMINYVITNFDKFRDKK